MAGLQAVVSVMPGFRQILGTAPLGLIDLFVIAGGVLGPLAVNEAMKPPMAKVIDLDEEAYSETITGSEEENQEND